MRPYRLLLLYFKILHSKPYSHKFSQSITIPVHAVHSFVFHATFLNPFPSLTFEIHYKDAIFVLSPGMGRRGISLAYLSWGENLVSSVLVIKQQTL